MFTIGEFSRIARVTPRQLRHYEELGLFKPERIDPESGYRYYSALQLPRLNRILVLKDLGLGLDQIVRLVDKDISAEEIHGMLAMRKAQLEQTLRDELSRVLSIEDRLRQIEDKGVLSDEDVVLKAVPAQQFLSIRQVVPSIHEGFRLIHELNRLVPPRAGKSVLGNFALVFHSDGFDTENVDVEMGFLLEQAGFDAFTLSEGRAMTVRTIPAIETMATMVNVGIAHHVSSYSTLGIWIEKNNFQLAGPGLEVFIEPFQPGKEDDAIIEIQLPVTRIAKPLDTRQYLINL
jgi:DNA-binding transcriptional MerR regulator